MYPRSTRMRPSAPLLLFWNVRASTSWSRLILPIFVRMRPIGRPWSWSIGGMPGVPVVAPAAGAAPPDVPGGLAAVAPLPAPAWARSAGWPVRLGGADCPTGGATGVVTPGFCAGMPGPVVAGPAGLRFGSPAAGGGVGDVLE